MEHVWGNINGLAGNLVGPSTVVTEAASYSANVAAGHGDGLSIVQRLNSSQEIGVSLDQVSELGEEPAALGRGNLAPCGSECLAGCGDSNVYVLLGGLGDGGNDFFGGGVDNLECLLVDTLNPLVVDEPISHKCC